MLFRSGKINDANFRDALTASLEANGLRANSGSCNYSIDVHILGISRPNTAFDTTVTMHMNYKVYEGSARTVMLESHSATYTATVADAYGGVERFRLAVEGSVRASISQFLDKLRGANFQAKQ